MKVRWTRKAVSHLDAIHDYIAADSPYYALQTIARIVSRDTQIAQFPASGKRVPETNDANLREVIEGNYRVIYRFDDTECIVIAVIHTARLLNQGDLSPAES